VSEKLTEIYSLRIPEHLKEMVERLDIEQRHALNTNIRTEIAKAIHASKFDAKVYLEEGQ
jgi:hypothetical protein